MDITPIKKNTATTLAVNTSDKLISHQVDTVVQEYMDSMLVDLFPEIPTVVDVAEPVASLPVSHVQASQPLAEYDAAKKHEPIPIHSKLRGLHGDAPTPIENSLKSTRKSTLKSPEETPEQSQLKPVQAQPVKPVTSESKVPPVNRTEATAPPSTQVSQPASNIDSKVNENKPFVTQPKLTVEPRTVVAQAIKLPQTATEIKNDTPVIEALTIKKTEPLRYPQAPVWAQQPFDVLLFNVCGLKLAVPMEALGRIIKVEHETSQLIGRPDWFMGAYNEQEHHFYVVDTAKYIMPEKGFDQATTGFEYLIQLQRSKWTLACQAVHTTIRLEPEQVKWRSNHSSRQWLAGTVIEHMCALITVDSLIELLEKQD